MNCESPVFQVGCRLVALSFLQYVKALPEPPPRKRLLSTSKNQSLWRELESDLLPYRLVTLAVNLPLRRGQVLALVEKVIDFENEFGSFAQRDVRRVRFLSMQQQQQCCERWLARANRLPDQGLSQTLGTAVLVRAKINKPGLPFPRPPQLLCK